ncbi:MAG: hypothetical protein ACYTG5_12190 [Planctomycetota bacterium]|jgi:hypothetical protein
MKSGTKILLLGGLFLLVLASLSIRRVPQPTSENTEVVRGILSSFRETESEDLEISLEGDEHYYYVNRFRGVGLDLERLEENLNPGDELRVTFIHKSWSLLDPIGHTRPVAGLAAGDQVFLDRVRR